MQALNQTKTYVNFVTKLYNYTFRIVFHEQFHVKNKVKSFTNIKYLCEEDA